MFLSCSCSCSVGSVIRWALERLWDASAIFTALAMQLDLTGGVGRRFSLVGYSGYVEDAAYVIVYCPAADELVISNLPVRLSSSDEPQHLHLPLAQTGAAGRSSGWDAACS